MKIGVTFEFEQYYLPTKRHKNPLKRKMVTSRDIEVHFIEEKNFPVAIRVTDFDILSHNWEDETESKYDTLEYRFDGKNLYEEPRSLSGSNKGQLVFPSEDAFMEHIRHHFCEELYDYLYDNSEDKQYKEGISVIVGDDIDARVDRLQTFADRYLICNGKVWKKCGQPYYKVQTFGCGNNHGGTGFFIDWTDSKEISRDYFLATQRDLALQDFVSTANGRGDTDSIKYDDSEKRNIEILIPDAYTLKRDLSSKEYLGYEWSDERGCYVKEYGPKPAHAGTFLVRFRHDYGDMCLAIVYKSMEVPYTNMATLWYVTGQVLEDCRNISFNDIAEVYSVGDDMDLLKYMDEHKEVAV